MDSPGISTSISEPEPHIIATCPICQAARREMWKQGKPDRARLIQEGKEVVAHHQQITYDQYPELYKALASTFGDPVPGEDEDETEEDAS